MMESACSSSRSSTGGRLDCSRASTRAFLSIGRNVLAIPACTRQTSSALQTEGRLVLALTMMERAFSKSASLSTYTWQMPVPVSMQGTVACSTQARMRPAPPLGMRRSTRPAASMIFVALWREVSSTMFTISGSNPAARTPSLSASTIALLDRYASFPGRSMQTFPLLRQSAAASEVTFGRLS